MAQTSSIECDSSYIQHQIHIYAIFNNNNNNKTHTHTYKTKIFVIKTNPKPLSSFFLQIDHKLFHVFCTTQWSEYLRLIRPPNMSSPQLAPFKYNTHTHIQMIFNKYECDVNECECLASTHIKWNAHTRTQKPMTGSRKSEQSIEQIHFFPRPYTPLIHGHCWNVENIKRWIVVQNRHMNENHRGNGSPWNSIFYLCLWYDKFMS